MRYDGALQGRLAQLGEHQLDKLGVTGSSPVPPTSEKPRYVGVFSFPGPASEGSSRGPLLARTRGAHVSNSEATD